ncbi:Radical SAM domain protein [Methanohalobium evestigatum Z-7303]|uniref:Radical SAM domain protein n=1 Tax=Methanohalobium evestigatum (strain ATCC BAA-1072 / DSM 3721 / NBRC 107634 / OCM 161 / Z-7303) TaxID=644295 RepID=D7EAI9_METEZ|nr:radical SAM protein [Methanohalobium evestigatum]ADI74988.1 Radical SAM domain protein [Methanohalobium evestigatum Z-7303]
MKHTKSLCPECCDLIDAAIYEEDGKIMIDKECDEHGYFKDVYWSDAELYKKFDNVNRVGEGVTNPMTTEGYQCPQDCGLCSTHKTNTILANIDLTNRCNLNCPICFANAKERGYIYEPSFEQIRDMLQMLRNEEPTPCYAVQFSGGEPTVRDDLPDIIAMARDMGFIQIQIATNGIRLAKDVEFTRKLKEAGLHTLYLQFDGVTEEPYKMVRGFNALPMKQQVVENCREVGIKSITLVPTLAKGVNDHQIGDMIRFASQNLDVIKGINFQPISFTGRINREEREQKRITIPDLFKLTEEQTDGEIPKDSWYPVPFVVPVSRFIAAIRNENIPALTCHQHCGAGTYVYVEDGKFIPITNFIDVKGLMNFLDEVTDEFYERGANKSAKVRALAKVARRVPSFIDSDKSPSSVNVTKLIVNVLVRGASEATKEFHRNTLFLGCMHFQDNYNFDIERIQRCGVHYATPDGRAIPFCTYNTLHREEVESKFSRPYEVAKAKSQ